MHLTSLSLMNCGLDAFDITIEDVEAERIRTPADLIELVFGKVAQANLAACLTQRAFNLLRAALRRHLPLKRRDIAPSVCMAALVPKIGRKNLLDQLATELRATPSQALVRPKWLVRLLTGICLTAAIAAGVTLLKLAPGTHPREGVFAAFLAAVLMGLFARTATQGLCTEFPPLAATVGDLARWIVAHKPDLASPTPGHWTREQVAARVREIVIEQLACASTYRDDASFIKDLGMG